MTADEPKPTRKWFEDVPIQPKHSHARTKPLVVARVNKRDKARPDQSAVERNKKGGTSDRGDA